MRLTWRTSLGAATVAVLAATAAAPTSAFGQGADTARRPLVGSQGPVHGSGASATVTLVTGDKVLLTGAGSSAPTVTVLPRPDGSVPVTETRRAGADVYVYPADAAGALADGRVDEELFNVTALVAMGFDDARTTTVPVIATYSAKGRKARSAAATPKGAARGKELRSIDAVALRADKAKAKDFWADATSTKTPAGAAIGKLWLDRKVHANLERSTAQVDAPAAWATGLTGTGTKVAVLDTGADGGHPDLEGRIVASQDFTGSPGGALSDLHGHGTHTASTVGGSGAASDGAKRGVAPGTDLLVGKVLGDDGGGYDSGIIAGMEWAVAQGADVVSMSLGNPGTPGDCTDPLASAAQHLATTSSEPVRHRRGEHRARQQHRLVARAAHPLALTVGAVDRDDATAPFSSRGPAAFTHTLKPEITAPGVGISAARAGGRGADAYRAMSGHLDGHPARRRGRRDRQAGPPGVDRWAELKAALVSSADTDDPG